jgi:hypothetical protein
MPFLAAGMAASGIAGGILSGNATKDAAQSAQAQQQQALVALFSKLDSVGMPPDQSARIILQQYQQAGTLTPALMEQLKTAQSQFSGIKQNQQATQMQSQALTRMSQMGQAGLTPDEMAQNRQLQMQAAQQGNAADQSIIQNMAQRGIQGGGAELAARLSAAQNMANTSSTAADQVSAQAQQRALQAIAQGSSMAGQLENQTFGEQAQQASAGDQMHRFNIQNQMAINQQNVSAQNQAQAANLANKQQISNQNVGNYNQESYNQLQRQNQQWQEKLALAQSYSQPLQAYGKAGAQGALRQGDAESSMLAGAFGGGISALGKAFKGSNNSSFGNGNNVTNSSNGANGASVGAGIDPNAGLPNF